MASVVIVGSDEVTAGWAATLRRAGHSVERCAGALSFQERFHGDPADVLVAEIVNADRGEAMLMVQARAVWPGCRVIAVPRDRTYRSSAIFRMGLWQPDRLLMQPVTGDLLALNVDRLWVEAEAERRITVLRQRRAPAPDRARDVILDCGTAASPRWSVRAY